MVLVAAIMVAGLFGPWITMGYDSYAKLNPQTRMGEKFYHSWIEFSPFYGSVYKDEALIDRYWFISPGTSLAGLIVAVSAFLGIIRYKANWAHFILFFFALVGVVIFFLNIGEGISIGVFTQIGWGLKLTSLGLLLFFLVSFMELSRNSISRFVD